MAAAFLSTERPATNLRIRDNVLDALRAMLVRVEEEPLEFTAVAGTGLTVMLRHEQVRCMLVIDLRDSGPVLSPREMEIARLVARGSTNRAIATMLDISTWTVSTHLRRIFAKLSVCSRAEMVNQLFAAPPMPASEVDWITRTDEVPGFV
jgi:DNA-binding CsgD family transcriptional regulator